MELFAGNSKTVRICTLDGCQSAVAHECWTQCTAKATRSQTEQGTPGHMGKKSNRLNGKGGGFYVQVQI